MWITFCQDEEVDITRSLLQLSLCGVFCYTNICGKIHNLKKSKTKKKTRFFSENENPRWAESYKGEKI